MSSPPPSEGPVHKPVPIPYARSDISQSRPDAATAFGIRSIYLAAFQLMWSSSVCLLAIAALTISLRPPIAVPMPVIEARPTMPSTPEFRSPTFIKNVYVVPSLSPVLITTAFASSIGSMLLAVLLLVAGILTLRARPAGRTLHRVWAWIKLPLAISGGIAIVGLLHYLIDANGMERQAIAMPPPRDPAMHVGAFVVGALAAMLSLTHAVGVLLVLRSVPARAGLATVDAASATGVNAITGRDHFWRKTMRARVRS